MTRSKPKPRKPGIATTAACRLALAAIITCGAWPLAAEPVSSSAAEPPVVYRRLYVPAGNVDAWPRDGEKYLPVESGDFEAWVAAANEAAAPIRFSAAIDSAEYHARLEDDGRLHGSGQWSITAPGGKPVFLPLPRLSLIIRNPRWKDAADQPARLGAWGAAAGEPARFGLSAPRTGVLEFDWSAQPQSRNGELELPWHVPAATTNRVVLDLPAGKQPSIDGSVVLESTPLPADPAKDAKPRRQWALALTPSLEATLRINSTGQAKRESAERLTLREEVDYQVQQRGLEIVADWRLEGPVGQQRELSVPLSGGIQLVSAASEGRELNWHIARGVSPSPDKAILTLPDPSDPRSLHVTLTAWQPLTLDRPWQLPGLRPDGVFWSAGQLGLAVASEFELRSLNPLDCGQTSVTQPGAGPENSESFSLTAYSPTAKLEVAISRRQPDAAIRVGSSLALADPDVTGRLVTEWNVSRSNLHRLSGALAPGWNVEAVETVPADAMAEWFIDRRDNRRHIEIQLTDAASPARNVSVIIVGRLQRFSLAEPISTDTLRMVRWTGARVARHLLSFQTTEPFVAETVGDLPLLARESIDPSDRALLDAAADDSRIVDLAHAGSNAGLQLTFKRGQYTAEIEVDVYYANGELRQTWQVAARPTANAIDRLLIFASAPLGDNVRWVEMSTNSPIVAERLPADDPQRKNLPKDGELWLLRLPQPTSKPIEILAAASNAASKRARVPLLALPEAIEQRGLAFVRGTIHSSPSVEPEGLIPTPLPTADSSGAPDENRPPVRAAFRFNPNDCLDPSRAPQLWIEPVVENGTTPLAVRYLNLESFIWPDGRAAHRATYELENYGAVEFKPTLPPGARLTAIFANGRALDSSVSGHADRLPPIQLSPEARSAIVAVYFETQQPPLTTAATLTPPVLQNGIPVLAGEWTARLPEEFAADGADRVDSGEFRWQQRLFGPLARSNRKPPFHPLRPADWARLINGFLDWNSAESPVPPLPGADDRNPQTAAPTLFTPLPGMTSVNVFSAAWAVSSSAPSPGESSSTLPGWHSVRQSFVADGAPNAIVVSRPAAVASWAVAGLFASFLLGRWFCRGRRTLLLGLITAAACLALLLPAALAPLATGALWGFALSAIGNWPRRPLATEGAPRSSLVRAAATGCLATILAVAVAQLALAETKKTNETNRSSGESTSAAEIERVLIPVDADNHPVGTKYFLSERFLRELIEPRSEERHDHLQWLLRDATYSGELSANRGQAEIAAGACSLAFSIETMARNTTILLPLVQNEAAWQPTAMLDGVPVPIVWREDGHTCAIEVAEPGRYVLTLFCVPKTDNTDGRGQFRLSVPPLLSATIRLRAPARLTGIGVANATLSPATNDAPGMLQGELTQTDRITVHWPRLEQKSSTSQGLSVAELHWLHVGVDGTELVTKYVVEGGARRPESLTIKYDDRWMPLADIPMPATDRQPGATDRSRLLHVPLPAEDIDRQEVSVRWKLNDAPPAGNIRLPPVALASVPTTQRWFAVSADPTLDCTVVDNTATAATAKEFLAKWGNTSESVAPQVVLANFDADRVWTLAIRPREAAPVVREVLHVAAGLQAARVVYQANVTPGNSSRFQFRLTVPAKFSVDEITLAEADRQIATRWMRDSDNRVNVFFGDAARSDYRLTVAGSLPIDSNAPVELPRVSVDLAPPVAQQVQLYRDDDVEIELQGFPAPDELKTSPPETPPSQWLVRPIGVYRMDETAARAAHFVVNPSRSEVSGDTFTGLTREGGSWWVAFRARLVASQGDLDVLRVRLPPTCPGPFDLESSVPASTDTLALDEHHRTLAIRFTTAVPQGKEVELQVRSPLAIPAGSSAFVPEIVVAALSQGRRYVGVPNLLDGQPVAWTDVGVQPAQVPQALLRGAPAITDQIRFEIVKDPCRVAVRSQTIRQPAPRIRLADTAVSVGQHGGQLLASRFVVASDGLAECTLQLPLDQQLLSVQLDGRPALTAATGGSRWRVALGAPQLPQVVEIVSRSSGNTSKDQIRELLRPTLFIGDTPIPVEVSLWSVAEPNQSAHHQIEGTSAVNAIDQAALRFDRLVSIAEAAAAAAAEAPRPDGANWFRPWAALLRDVQDQTRQITNLPAAATTVAQVSRSAEEQIIGVSKRLEMWLQESNKHFTEADAPPSPKAAVPIQGSFAPFHVSDHRLDGRQVTYYVAEGGADRLILKRIPSVATLNQIRVLGLLAIVGLATAGAWLIRSPAAADFLCRWPEAFGILLGIAYWAWLWPSWLGLLIAAASLWLALRFAWPGHSLRPEASTVLRSTRLQ